MPFGVEIRGFLLSIREDCVMASRGEAAVNPPFFDNQTLLANSI